MAAPGIIIKGNVVTESEILFGGWIEVVGEHIVKVERHDVELPAAYIKDGKIVSAPGFVIPGFIDIHNHGAGGPDELHLDVCDHWLEPTYSEKDFASHGTTSVLASLILSKENEERTKQLIETVENRVGRFTGSGCVIEGIHCEGPVIADVGGLPPQDDKISLEKFKVLCYSMPSLKVMTISPSLEAKTSPPYARIKHLCDIGVRPSLGHDRLCTAQEIRGALAAAPPGTRMHTTHYCNVMSFHHRKPSLVNFCLVSRFPRTAAYVHGGGGGAGTPLLPPTTEVIADLVHVHPLTIQALLSARLDSVSVISDCISDYRPGKLLKYNGRSIVVSEAGGCYIADKDGKQTATLAGSTVTIADQFHSLMSVFGLSVVDACKVTSLTPAKIANISNRVGSIAVGKKANILLLDGALTTIQRRMIYGNWFEAPHYKMMKPATAHL